MVTVYLFTLLHHVTRFVLNVEIKDSENRTYFVGTLMSSFAQKCTCHSRQFKIMEGIFEKSLFCTLNMFIGSPKLFNYI